MLVPSRVYDVMLGWNESWLQPRGCFFLGIPWLQWKRLPWLPFNCEGIPSPPDFSPSGYLIVTQDFYQS